MDKRMPKMGLFSILSIDSYMDSIVIRTLSDVGGLFSRN